MRGEAHGLEMVLRALVSCLGYGTWGFCSVEGTLCFNPSVKLPSHSEFG